MSQSVASLTGEFIDYLNFVKNSSLATITNYQRYLNHFNQSFPELLLADLKLSLIKQYKNLLIQSGFRPTTQNYHLIALRSLTKFLVSVKKTKLDFEPNQISLHKIPPQPKTDLSAESLENLIHIQLPKTIAGLRDKSILELLACTGLKVSELTSLNRNDVQANFRQINLPDRNMLLSPSCSLAIEKYLNSRQDLDPALFIRLSKRGFGLDSSSLRLSTRSIERIIKSIGQKTGASVSPSTLRDTYAKNLFNSETKLETIKKNLGHSHKSSTRNLSKQLQEV